MNEYDDIYENQGNQLSKENYAAIKKAERDGLFALSDNMATEVAGDSVKFQQYLDVQSKFDRYSAVNSLLILAQKPNATRIADFEHWKSLGGFVKPGQSAISILEPREYAKENGAIGNGYNVKKVFDISQVDKVKTDPLTPYTERQILAALITKTPMKISGADVLADDVGAMTDPQTGEIFVRKNMGFVDIFRSISQELGCYEVSKSVDKILVNPFFAGYCTAYMLCKKYGVETKSFNFTNAPEIFRNLTPPEIKAQLSVIRDAVNNIAGRMIKQLGTAQKSAKAQELR